MSATITLGHVLIAAAALAALGALVQFLAAARHRGHGRGTPGYARARTARRAGAYALVLALLFVVVAVTPLGAVAIVGAA